MCTSNTILHFWRHLPLLNAARGKLGGTLAPIPKPMSAPQQPTPTFVLTVKTIIGGQSENRLKVSSKRLSAVRFSPRQPHVWTFPAKASRKGPRNLLSCDQSVMAKTMSENAPLKSFAKAIPKISSSPVRVIMEGATTPTRPAPTHCIRRTVRWRARGEFASSKDLRIAVGQ